MNIYYCPKCNIDFESEEEEAAFCPNCLITLATPVTEERKQEQSNGEPLFNQRWDLVIAGVVIVIGSLYTGWVLLDLIGELYPVLLIGGVILGAAPKYLGSLLTETGKRKLTTLFTVHPGEEKELSLGGSLVIGGIIFANILLVMVYFLFALPGALMGGLIGVLLHFVIMLALLLPAGFLRRRYRIRRGVLHTSYLLPLLLFAIFLGWRFYISG